MEISRVRELTRAPAAPGERHTIAGDAIRRVGVRILLASGSGTRWSGLANTQKRLRSVVRALQSFLYNAEKLMGQVFKAQGKYVEALAAFMESGESTLCELGGDCLLGIAVVGPQLR
jgi:hypothetical protein